LRLRIDTQESVATISPDRRFDFSSQREFRTAYEEVLGNTSIRVIKVDMKEVDFIDSSALGMLLLLKDKSESSGHKIIITNSQGSVRMILDVANFDKLFSIT